MAFQKVSEADEGGQAGKFTTARRKLFNLCGQNYYMGSLKFKDALHRDRRVPIFLDECLEDMPQSYKLLKQLRKTMKLSFEFSSVYLMRDSTPGSARSIHQNENGYLPYKKDGGVGKMSVAAPAIMGTAQVFGELPHNQKLAEASTNGQFLEYTFGDQMHQECRFIVDYRFGMIYMTLGHYNPHSFALLVRSSAELDFEIKPVLPALGATFEA